MVDFKKVKPSDLWYVIGYITTDGCLSKSGRHIYITSKDRKHLYLIRKALYLKNKVGKKSRSTFNTRTYSYLQFGDIKFYNYLLSLGLSQQKSLTLGSVKVDMSFFNDFLRGVIDGDGNISTWIHKTNHNRQWCLRIFSAAEMFIISLNDIIMCKFGVKGRLYARNEINKENPIYILKFGKTAAKVILSQIYYENCLSLERKFLQAKKCLQGEV